MSDSLGYCFKVTCSIFFFFLNSVVHLWCQTNRHIYEFSCIFLVELMHYELEANTSSNDGKICQLIYPLVLGLMINLAYCNILKINLLGRASHGHHPRIYFLTKSYLNYSKYFQGYKFMKNIFHTEYVTLINNMNQDLMV